jgi:hypothetical protein
LGSWPGISSLQLIRTSPSPNPTAPWQHLQNRDAECVCPPNFHNETLLPKVMVFGR